MSHYHTEILIPPNRSADVEAAVAEIMAPFCEHGGSDNDEPKPPTEGSPADWSRWADEYRDWANDNASTGKYAFWDFYTIGGRWAGQHTIDRYDPEVVKRFYGELADRKVTVSGVQFGKQELSPPEQIPMVDALWQEMFPSSGLAACPMFMHSNPRNGGQVAGDVCRVGELGQWATADRLIIAGPTFVYDRADPDASYHTLDTVEAGYMVERQYYNGVAFLDSSWDGRVASAIDAHSANLSHYKPEAAALRTVSPEWLAVTVDYHS